jgi:hypothetical protein
MMITYSYAADEHKVNHHLGTSPPDAWVFVGFWV